MSSETQDNLNSEQDGYSAASINLSYSSWAVAEVINDSDVEVCTEIPDTVSENTSIFVVVVAVIVKRKFLLI
jgi:hypothetical protein